MGIAPVQPENLGKLAVLQSSQLAAFADGLSGWCLAAYQPLGLSAAPAGGWRAVRVQAAFVTGAPQAASRIGPWNTGGVQRDAGATRESRKVKLLTPRLLTIEADVLHGTGDEGDGLGAKVRAVVVGDRFVIPASVLGLTGSKVNAPPFIGIGDVALTVDQVVADEGFILAEARV